MCPLRPQSFVHPSTSNNRLVVTKQRTMPINPALTSYIKVSYSRPASNSTGGLQNKIHAY